ncbi:methyltransferase domain-containing protein [Maribellus comscasis]|uniref:Methyltransferase domain-containing protein n=1 Tax=Maribellus comscasis TaxID=2681766 RepID=A0A6I6K2G6_9BACT|nr:class I SAM-dependent methyltransferase [Maribellus comscasis]QGY47590.1 methyltransferase domain-containing protein [Maribellus comscasis]
MEDRINKERKFWDSFAKRYDKNRKKSGTNEAYKNLFKIFKEDIAGIENLLETATGTGLISLQLSSLVSEITAIDLSPEMLKIAQEKARKQEVVNINFREGDICNLDFPNNFFDAAIASNVLHLLFEPGKAMQEIKRVVKPGGTVIIPTYCHGENLQSHFFSRCMNIMGFRARTRWSVVSFQEFVKENGFEIVRQEILKGAIPMVYLVAMDSGSKENGTQNHQNTNINTSSQQP